MENPPGSHEWWNSGVAGFALRAALAVVFSIAFLLRGVHPAVALLPVVLFALYAGAIWWKWRTERSPGGR